MPSGYQVNGVDLDSIFAVLQPSMTPAAATSFKVAGADLNARYAPRSYGGAALVTGFKIATGADINTVFAALGSTSISIVTQPSAVSGVAAAGTPSGTVTSGAMTCTVIGGSPPYTYTWHVSGGASAVSPGSPTTRMTAVVNGQSTLSGSAYCTIMDSVGHSINTSSAPYTLQNTSPAGDVLSMVAGTNSINFPGQPGFYKQGGAINWEGSMSPGSLGDGSPVTALMSNNNGLGSNPGWWFIDVGPILEFGAANPVTQGYLKRLIVSGPGIGTVDLSGPASVFTATNPQHGSWAWGPGLPAFTPGATYSVTVVRFNQ